MSRKDKKIEKKLAKFNERDLRSYPMTVWKWIGTFILLALPIINVISCICWFFGVGNKSRSAWIRAHVLRFFIIVVLIVAIIGGGFLMLKNAASKEMGAETPTEVIFYGVCKFADLIGGDTGEMIKAAVAQGLGIEYEPQLSDGDSSQGGDNYNDDGWNDDGWEDDGYSDDEYWGYGY